MHSSEGERGLCLRDGGRAQGLPPRLRRRSRSGLHGRVEQVGDQADPGAAADAPRPAGHQRFRIRAQRHGEPVHGARSASGMAPRRGDGPPHETRFRASSPGHGGDRDRRSVQAVPGPAHPGPRDARARGRRLAGAAQRRGDARRLAFQDRGRSREAEVALPNNTMLKEY